MNMSGHGIAVDLAPGWEGAMSGGAKSREGGGPVVHLSTAPLPPGRGDFGSGAVDELGADDAFVALVEYGPECAGTAMFARDGLPRRLRATSFNRRGLQRTIDGQCGHQVFFTEHGRPFCLYVVLGRAHDVQPLLDRVHEALDNIRID